MLARIFGGCRGGHCQGRLTMRDYDKILVPAVEAASRAGRRSAATTSSVASSRGWMPVRPVTVYPLNLPREHVDQCRAICVSK